MDLLADCQLVIDQLGEPCRYLLPIYHDLLVIFKLYSRIQNETNKYQNYYNNILKLTKVLINFKKRFTRKYVLHMSPTSRNCKSGKKGASSSRIQGAR